VSAAGKLSLSPELIFCFLQKYRSGSLSSGTVVSNSFIPDGQTLFLSSGTESFDFPMFSSDPDEA
jgi:hypothetical protein